MRIMMKKQGSGVPVTLYKSATLENTIINPNSNQQDGGSDEFGLGVDVYGNKVVIGAQGEDAPGATGAGAAYLYDFDVSTTVPELTFTNPDPQSYARFGCSVTMYGNYVAIGANGSDNNSGAVYVYDISSGTPTTPIRTILNQDVHGDPAHDAFGNWVQLNGTTLAVGAPNEEYGSPVTAIYSGKVYIYNAISGQLLKTLVHTNSTSPLNVQFGRKVRMHGNKCVVSAHGENRSYVFDITTGSLLHTLEHPEGVGITSNFGEGVDINERYVVVGAPLYYAGGSQYAGGAYVFDMTSSTPEIAIASIEPPVITARGYFGVEVRIAGDNLFITAFGESVSKIFMYDLTDINAAPFEIDNPNPASTPYVTDKNDFFGYTINVSGNRIITGAMFENIPTQGNDQGIAYTYLLNV